MLIISYHTFCLCWKQLETNASNHLLALLTEFIFESEPMAISWLPKHFNSCLGNDSKAYRRKECLFPYSVCL